MDYYLDTEFDGFRGPLISLALIAEDGSSLYMVLREHADDPWVQENVLPHLWAAPSTRIFTPEAAAREIAMFLAGDPEPIIVADWPADIRYFCELIELPGGAMVNIPQLAFALERIEAYPTTLQGAVRHNAWWDAAALREKYQGAAPHG